MSKYMIQVSGPTSRGGGVYDGGKTLAAARKEAKYFLKNAPGTEVTIVKSAPYHKVRNPHEERLVYVEDAGYKRDPGSRRGYSKRDPATLVVHRKAYTRKSGTRVKASTFRIEDKGRPGKTPKSQQFYHPHVKMGWHKDQPASLRRKEALLSHHGNTLAAGRALQALANVTTDSKTKKIAKSDADYFFSIAYDAPRESGRRDPASKVRFTPEARGFSKLRRELGPIGNALWHLPKPSPFIIYWNGPGARLLFGSNKPGTRLSPIDFPGADGNYRTLKEATAAVNRFWKA